MSTSVPENVQKVIDRDAKIAKMKEEIRKQRHTKNI